MSELLRAATAASRRRISTVEVRMMVDGQSMYVATVRRDKLVKFSLAYRVFLKEYKVADESRRTVTLPEGFADVAAMKIVLESIEAYWYRRDKHVVTIQPETNTGDRCLIWQACHRIHLQPAADEESMRNNIAYRLSHQPCTPYDMAKVHQIFRPFCETFTPYPTMVHQHVWDLLQGNYASQEVIDALAKEANQLEGLAADISAKYAILEPKRREHELYQALNASRRRSNKQANTK